MKKLLLKSMLLLCALIVGSGSIWADDETITFSELGLTNAKQYTDPFGTNISVTFAGGSNDGKYYTTGSGIRTYGNGTITITAKGNTITKIVTTFSGDSYAPSSTNVWSSDGTDDDNKLTSGVNATWEGNATEVVMTRPSGSGHWRLQAITVYYSTGSSTPSISAENVNLAYDATGGSIAYSLTNATGNVSAVVTDGDWLTLGTVTSSAVPFTCEANTGAARTAKVTLSFTGASDKVVTVTQAAAPLTTIDQIFAAATSAGSTATDCTIAFNNWVVTGVKNSNAYVTDGTKGFIIYASGHGFEVGNILSGTATCKVQLYNGSSEITNLTSSTTGLTVTTGGTVTPQDIAISDLSGVNTGAVIQLNEVTYDGTYLKDENDNEIKPYNTLYTGTFVSGKKYNVTGVYVQYNTSTTDTKEILPRSAGDIEEVVSTDPVINASNISIEYDATSGEIAYTIDNPTSATLTASTTADWISNITVESEKVTFTTTANDGDADRSAQITLSYTGAEDKVVTVTQGHYVIDFATLPFEFNGGRNDIENTVGLTHSGLGTDYNSTTNPTTQLKFDTTGDYMILKINEEPDWLSFDIKGNSFSKGTFTVQTSADGVNYTELKKYTELGDVESESFELASTVRYIKWIYTGKVSGNVGLGNICVAKTVSVTISAAGLATFASDEKLDFAKVDGVEAYIAKENNSKIELTKVNTVPAGTGVLLRSVSGAAISTIVPITDADADDVTDNIFVRGTGAAVNSENAGKYNYVLGKHNGEVGFYKAGGMTVATDKAYLQTTIDTSARLDINFDETTGIQQVESTKVNAEGYYNLNGQRVAQPTKGLYIVNGKKVIVK